MIKKVPIAIVSEPDIPVDIHIFQENRRSVRIALLKTRVNLRIPLLISSAEKEKYIQWGINWVKKKVEKDITRFPQQEKVYKDGDILKIMGNTLQIKFLEDPNKKRPSGTIQDDQITLIFPKATNEIDIQSSARYMVRKLLCRKFLPYLKHRVFKLNNLYFNQFIHRVNLKYNTSNWGSCSANHNLNFSLRLLFAPNEVIDYVIQHELAHLLEMNHSPHFWKLLKKIDPDYMVKEKWLKANSYTPFV